MLDLNHVSIDRVLPMLSGQGCSPELLHFAPYTPMQLSNIIKRKLASGLRPHLTTSSGLSPDTDASALDNTAIQLCAAKVGASGGDLRCALNICRSVHIF